jgi:2-polyprenyl-6-methoxyphenol hydroxylase-like FAD-dependent oxidoreductase
VEAITQSKHLEVVVIGSSKVGTTLAMDLAAHGQKVAMVKRRTTARRGNALSEELSHMSIAGLMSDDRLTHNRRLTMSKTLAESHVQRIRSHSIQYSSKYH